MSIDQLGQYIQQAKAFFQNNMPMDAEHTLKKALSIYPDCITILNQLLRFYLDTDRLSETKEIIEKLRIIQGKEELSGFQHMCIREYIRKTADWKYYQEEIDWFKSHSSAESVPFYAVGMPISEEEFLQIQKSYLKKHEFSTNLKLTSFDFSKRRFDNRKINLGFMSANWRNHPEAFLIGELFESIDRKKFNVFLYDIDPLQLPQDRMYKQRIVDAVQDASYKDVHHLSDWEIVKQIYSDKIDILFDTNAFTFFNRINVLTFKPAPIQVSYMGYPETLGGVQGIDYVVADSFVLPPEHQKYYAEKVFYLDPCAYTYDNKSFIPMEQYQRKDFGLPEDAVVLACFCNDYKITPDYLTIWARILKKVPKTVLWLYSQNELFENNIRKELEKRGVCSSRVYFTYRQPHPEYMAKQKLADLFLDTQYCNAHTTASEALMMGVPIITCPGNTWASRVAGSILTCLNMPELITQTTEEYEEKILFYATHPEELKKLKEKLIEKKKTADFFNPKVYAKNFEKLCLNLILSYMKK